MLRTELAFARKLDRGNPNPGNIGADFGRLGLSIWVEILSHDTRNAARRSKLIELSIWRNAIAHQDLDGQRLEPGSLTLRVVATWRSACDGLAVSFDRVMARHVESITGTAPW